MQEKTITTMSSKNYIEEMLNMEESEEATASISEVTNFFDGCNVLVTGGSGFLGKVLVEKLLRSFPNMGKLYMLIRPKKGKDPDERFKEMFENVLFDTLKKENPSYADHVVVIEGDTGEENLGLSPENRATLIENTHVVFNAAATVRFYERLRKAIHVNVRSVKMMLLLAKDMKNLKAFVHVSTAYSHTDQECLEEKFYEPRIEVDRIIKLVDFLEDEDLDKISPTLMKGCPNTYAYTKALGEEALRLYGRGLPTCVVRPSICVSTAEQPVRGWTDCLYGTTGICVGAMLGVLRVVQCDGTKVMEIIPIDYVCNNMIVAAWDTCKHWNQKLESKEKPEEDPVVFNAVSSSRAPISYHDFLNMNRVHGSEVPSTLMIWYHFLIFVQSKFKYDLYKTFLHILPALVMDFLAKMTGQPAILYKTYQKVHNFSTVLTWVSTKDWTFLNGNVVELWERMSDVDRSKFNFNVANLDWDEFCKYQMRGLRVYTLKDPMTTLDKGRAKRKMFKIAHYTVVTIIWVFLAWCVALLARLFLSFFS